MIYTVLLILIAAIAYTAGSFSTLALGSNFVFRDNLFKLGRGNAFISNFYRVHGVKGIALLTLTELVRDIFPILVGSLLLGIKGHADVGRAFAGFCLVMGRLYPVFYDFKGSHAAPCLIVAAMMVNFSAGIAVAVTFVALTLLSRYMTVGAAASAVVLIVVSVLSIDESLVLRLCIFMAAAVLIKHIPAYLRIRAGKEERLSFKKDISYKFDEKF